MRGLKRRETELCRVGPGLFGPTQLQLQLNLLPTAVTSMSSIVLRDLEIRETTLSLTGYPMRHKELR